MTTSAGDGHSAGDGFSPHGGGASSFADALKGRLMAQRTLVLQEALTGDLVARVTEQLALLAADSEAPIKALVGLRGRAAAPGLALYDAFQAARVQAVATGRVAGAGVVAFCGARERYALPGARFRLEEPTATARDSSLEADAKEAAAERERLIALVARATRQTPERVERDLTRGAAFDAEEAVRYGLAARVVESARDVD